MGLSQNNFRRPFSLLAFAVVGDKSDLAGRIDFNAAHLHAGAFRRENGALHVRLAECGFGFGHQFQPLVILSTL